MLIYNMMIVKSGTVDIHDIDVVETQSFYLEKGQPIDCLEITLLSPIAYRLLNHGPLVN